MRLASRKWFPSGWLLGIGWCGIGMALVAQLPVAQRLVAQPFADDSKGDWRSWRGPASSGSIEEGSFPDQLGSDQLLWKAPLPGKGCSTPIFVEGRICLTAPSEGVDSVLALDRQGKLLWTTKLEAEDPGKHRNGSGSNASPVSNGKQLFVYFKSGTLAALDLDGKVQWNRNLVKEYGKDTLFWDHGTSPVLTAKHVIMARMHQGESWLAAWDQATGNLAWKVARNYQVPTECDHGYSTPLVIDYQGEEAILVWGGEHVTIHRSTDGKELWSCGNFNPDKAQLWPAIATPVLDGDMAVIAYGRNDRGIPRLHGIRLAGHGDVTSTSHVWKREDVGTFVPSPSLYRHQVVLVGDLGTVEGIDPATGKTIWKGEFPKSRANFYASPLVAAGKVFAPREDGVVFVGRIEGESFRILSENDLGESVIGSPVPLGDQILLRGEKHLYCFGG